LIRVTFFKKEKTESDFKVQIVERSFGFKKEHSLSLKRNNIEYDYYAGVINELGESKMIKI